MGAGCLLLLFAAAGLVAHTEADILVLRRCACRFECMPLGTGALAVAVGAPRWAQYLALQLPHPPNWLPAILAPPIPRFLAQGLDP